MYNIRCVPIDSTEVSTLLLFLLLPSCSSNLSELTYSIFFFLLKLISQGLEREARELPLPGGLHLEFEGPLVHSKKA